MPLYFAQSGDLDRCHRCPTDSLRKDRATQLLIKYKSGALVTQLEANVVTKATAINSWAIMCPGNAIKECFN